MADVLSGVTQREEEILRRRVLKRCTPSLAAYRAYRDDVDVYMEATRGRGRPLRLHGAVGEVRRLELRRSILFGRDYLIAWVDPEWLMHVAPSCDAIAACFEPTHGFEPPPMVVAPSSKRRSHGREFTSVVEHEMVHVNQALRGRLRWSREPATVRALLDAYFEHTAMEFEAEILQRSQWPYRSCVAARFTLAQWCLLRGHTQALERVLREFALERMDERLGGPFVAGVAVEARQRLRGLGIGKDLLAWFEARWAQDVLVALTVIESQGVHLASAKRLRPIAQWLRDQPDVQRLIATSSSST